MKLLSQQGLGAMVLLTSGIVDERPPTRGRSLSTAHALAWAWNLRLTDGAEVLAHCWALRDQASRPTSRRPSRASANSAPQGVRRDAGGFEP